MNSLFGKTGHGRDGADGLQKNTLDAFAASRDAPCSRVFLS
jgi:hypothetical protein